LGQVLDIIALVIIAALSEKTMMHHFVDIKLIKKRVAILCHQLVLNKNRREE
jgi:hypothetical protein